MSEAVPFDELIRLVRAGDEQAARELVRRYEPAIRRAHPAARSPAAPTARLAGHLPVGLEELLRARRPGPH
jgi:hypothetical protein